jgi:hypothetical protein
MLSIMDIASMSFVKRAVAAAVTNHSRPEGDPGLKGIEQEYRTLYKPPKEKLRTYNTLASHLLQELLHHNEAALAEDQLGHHTHLLKETAFPLTCGRK